MLKDAGLALTLAHRLPVPQLLAALVRELCATALNQGLNNRDTTAFVQVLVQLAGIRLDAA